PMTAAIPVTAPRDGVGLNGQAGYLIPRLPIEFVARLGCIFGTSFDAIKVTNSGSTSLPDQNTEVAGGINWYIARHPFKLQTDITKMWINDNFQQGDIRFRVQLQASL